METVDVEEVEEVLKPIQEALLKGTIKHVGLSNCKVEHIKRAQHVLPEGALLSVQNEYSMWCRDAERDGVLEYCQSEGLAFLPYSALGGEQKRRGGRSLRDKTLFPAIGAVVDRTGASAEQVSLAWMLAKWPCLVHITSARHVAHLENSVGAATVSLTPEEIEAIDRDGPDYAGA
jgi:pyridoxine 4-dehydrogenase